MSKNIKRCLTAVAVIALTAVLVYIMVVLFDMAGFGDEDSSVKMNIAEGATLSSIAEDLDEAGVVTTEKAFRLYARVNGSGVYQMGAHTFNRGMSYSEIIAELEKMPQVQNIKITIPEGYELRQIADILEENGLINREKFMREIEVGSFQYDFVQDIPSRENRLEGYLFPDTYMFSDDDSEHEIINIMLENFNKIVVPMYEQSGTTKSLDEIVKLASVIEREAAGDDERGLVASVFVNRINMDMKLESCATVQYILKERKNVLSNEDIKIDSPYNTYMYTGLPVGPIASPGAKSVEAALYPAETSYLYFLANSDGTGSIFSETFEEHLQKQQSIQR